MGLGLYDELGMSLRGQAEAKACDYAFIELYTSRMPGLSIENLSRLVGREVEVLSRADVEEHAESKILPKAKSARVAFFVAGDPMVATTHVDLRLRAHKAGIETRIIHAASITSAVAGTTGLQSYKFGRTITIPVARGDHLPNSVLSALSANREAKLHTLILLEVDVERNLHVTIPQALDQLLAASAKATESMVTAETLVVGVARLEGPDMTIRAGKVSQIRTIEFEGPPHCLIIPSELHFVEAEALQVFCGAPIELVSGTK